MIACDNPACRPLEWFHVRCLGVRYISKGKWYRPECEDEFKQSLEIRNKYTHINILYIIIVFLVYSYKLLLFSMIMYILAIIGRY